MQSAYNKVAREYSEVFTDISLRCFEWPWLKKIILDLKPDSLLDLGCGNGYLIKALSPFTARLYGIEPCEPMFRIAEAQLGGKAVLYNSFAENLPFGNGYFDLAVSFLSFRYMEWEKSLLEIHRVLKPDGRFIVIDLFAAAFNPFKLGLYFTALVKTRLQYACNKEFRKRLKKLSQNPDWLEMVMKYPKRELYDAKQALKKEFSILDEKTLCHSVSGKTVGLVCKKKIV